MTLIRLLYRTLLRAARPYDDSTTKYQRAFLASQSAIRRALGGVEHLLTVPSLSNVIRERFRCQPYRTDLAIMDAFALLRGVRAVERRQKHGVLDNDDDEQDDEEEEDDEYDDDEYELDDDEVRAMIDEGHDAPWTQLSSALQRQIGIFSRANHNHTQLEPRIHIIVRLQKDLPAQARTTAASSTGKTVASSDESALVPTKIIDIPSALESLNEQFFNKSVAAKLSRRISDYDRLNDRDKRNAGRNDYNEDDNDEQEDEEEEEEDDDDDIDEHDETVERNTESKRLESLFAEDDFKDDSSATTLTLTESTDDVARMRQAHSAFADVMNNKVIWCTEFANLCETAPHLTAVYSRKEFHRQIEGLLNDDDELDHAWSCWCTMQRWKYKTSARLQARLMCAMIEHGQTWKALALLAPSLDNILRATHPRTIRPYSEVGGKEERIFIDANSAHIPSAKGDNTRPVVINAAVAGVLSSVFSAVKKMTSLATSDNANAIVSLSSPPETIFLELAIESSDDRTYCESMKLDSNSQQSNSVDSLETLYYRGANHVGLEIFDFLQSRNIPLTRLTTVRALMTICRIVGEPVRAFSVLHKAISDGLKVTPARFAEAISVALNAKHFDYALTQLRLMTTQYAMQPNATIYAMLIACAVEQPSSVPLSFINQCFSDIEDHGISTQQVLKRSARMIAMTRMGQAMDEADQFTDFIDTIMTTMPNAIKVTSIKDGDNPNDVDNDDDDDDDDDDDNEDDDEDDDDDDNH